MTNLNKKLDQIQRREQLQRWSAVIAFIAIIGVSTYLTVSQEAKEFRFVKVVGAEFQADDRGPIWRIEVAWDGRIASIYSATRPAGLSTDAYICISLSPNSGALPRRPAILPDGICHQNGIFEPD